MPQQRRVLFGRINRRRPDEPTFDVRPFDEDMRALADSHLTTATVGDAVWTAADMTVDSHGNFMTGVLGFSERDQRRQFDRDTWSWVKGETEETEGASAATTVPF